MGRGIRYVVLAWLLFFIVEMNAHAVILYDASPGQTPVDQGWTYGTLTPALVSMSAVPGGTSLQTTTDNFAYAGFGRNDFALNRTIGYTLNFDVQIISESHGSNVNRSGFSVIAISDIDKMGIELSFWTDQIFAKNNDIPTFSHVATEEITMIDTTIMRSYQLAIHGSNYTLTSTGLPTLTGILRDYSASSFDIYKTPNALFFGDNTTSAGANILLGSISLQAIPEPGTWAMGTLLLLGLGAVKMRRSRIAT